jgi:hypothetical protein
VALYQSILRKDDSIGDASTIAHLAMQKDVIGGAEVSTQDTEFEWVGIDESVL